MPAASRQRRVAYTVSIVRVAERQPFRIHTEIAGHEGRRQQQGRDYRESEKVAIGRGRELRRHFLCRSRARSACRWSRPEKRQPAAALWSPDRDTPEGRSLRGFVRVAPARYERLEPALLARNASPQPQERGALIAQGVRQDSVFDLIQLGGDLLRGLADRVGGSDQHALKQRRAVFKVAPFSAWSLTAMAERAGWWRAVKRNCGHKAKRRSVASIPPWSSWRTSWSVPQRASPPQCRLGWRSLDKNTSRASGEARPARRSTRASGRFPRSGAPRQIGARARGRSRRRPKQATASGLVELERPGDAGSKIGQIDSRRLCGHFPSNQRRLPAVDES